MWQWVSRNLVKLAVWAAGHPDEVKAILASVKKAKSAKP